MNYVPATSHEWAFAHFQARVRERLGPDFDATALWCLIIQHFKSQAQTENIRFLKRLSNKNRRLWLVRSSRREPFFLIYDHNIDVPITVLLPCHSLNIGGVKTKLETFL